MALELPGAHFKESLSRLIGKHQLLTISGPYTIKLKIESTCYQAFKVCKKIHHFPEILGFGEGTRNWTQGPFLFILRQMFSKSLSGQAGLELMILPPSLPECWDCNCVPSCWGCVSPRHADSGPEQNTGRAGGRIARSRTRQLKERPLCWACRLTPR